MQATVFTRTQENTTVVMGLTKHNSATVPERIDRLNAPKNNQNHLLSTKEPLQNKDVVN